MLISIAEYPDQETVEDLVATFERVSVSRKTIEPDGGAAHVPSPRQKVVDEADVPEFKLETGILPLICLEPRTVKVLLLPLIVLLVKVSEVARAINVSVDVGSVSVPVLTILDILGVTSVGDVAKTTLPLPVTAVKDVPATLSVLGPAVSIVLFVKVSVVALPTNVSVDVGRVRVPVLTNVGVVTDVEKTGLAITEIVAGLPPLMLMLVPALRPAAWEFQVTS